MRLFTLTIAALTLTLTACDLLPEQVAADLDIQAPTLAAELPSTPPEPGTVWGPCLVGTLPAYHVCAEGLVCAIPFGPGIEPTTICVQPGPANCDPYAQIVGPDELLYSVPSESDGYACTLPCETDADCEQVGMICNPASLTPTCGWA